MAPKEVLPKKKIKKKYVIHKKTLVGGALEVIPTGGAPKKKKKKKYLIHQKTLVGGGTYRRCSAKKK